MSAEVRLALVGCGAIADWHADAVADNPRVRITHAIDVDPERARSLADRVGARAFSSVADAVADGGFDAAAVLVPPIHHEKVAVELLRARKHVMLEKPMANSLEECDRIMAVAAESDVVFMVAENGQYWPEVCTAVQLIADGAIGSPVTIRAVASTAPMASFYSGSNAWRKDAAAAGGGIAVDVASHWFRPLRMLAGEITETVAVLGHPYSEMEGESLVRSLLRFESGIVGSFDGYVTLGPTGYEPRFRITGTRGEITADQRGSVMLYDAENPKGIEMGSGRTYMDSYAAEHEDFAAAILDGSSLAAGPDAALGELRIALAMYASAESGQWEKVWS